jgi:hypothetical protein
VSQFTQTSILPEEFSGLVLKYRAASPMSGLQGARREE